MSFFDETDEPEPYDDGSRTRERRIDVDDRPRRRGGSRPPTSGVIQQRRIGAVIVLVIIVLLFALMIRGCQSNANTSALKDYTSSVNNYIGQSNVTGQAALAALKDGSKLNSSGKLSTQLDSDLQTASSQLSHVQQLSVPSAMQTAQQHLELVFQMRVDALKQIANNAVPAYTASTAAAATAAIAGAGANLFASDVIYKNYVGTAMARALNQAGITIGGTNGVTINAGQLINDLGWLSSTQVASWMGSSGGSSSSSSNAAASINNANPTGSHGHQLNSVSVGGTELTAGTTNTVTLNGAPTFTLSFTNSGANEEANVGCQVTVTSSSSSTPITGTSTVGETQSGQSYTCNVTLPSTPAAGTYTVTATIEKVRYETDTANNTLTYTVAFSG